jgi:hypothetical protein
MLSQFTGGQKGQALLWIEGHEAIFNKLGAALFFGGYLLAVITGAFFEENGTLVLILVLLGLAVGVLNVTSREVMPYLVAAIALIVIGGTQVFTPLNLAIDGLGESMNLIVRMMAVFTAPAALVQAIRAGMHLARPGEEA